MASCNSPYVSSPIGTDLYCNSACPTGQFMNASGSCFAQCPSPFYQSYEFCLSPCTSSEFAHRNGTCISSCPSPWTSRSDLPYAYCDTICNYTAGEYLTQNNTCETTCNAPMVSISSFSYNYCQTPCPNQYYRLDKGDCANECLFPYYPTVKYGMNVCAVTTVVPVTTTQVAISSQSAAQVGSTVGAVMGSAGGGASAFGMLTLARFLFYTRYLQINYP